MGLESFGVRVIVTVVMGPLILLAAWFGGIVFSAFVAFLSFMALREFYFMTEQKEIMPQKVLGLTAGIILNLLMYYSLHSKLWIFFTFVSILFIVVELFRNKPHPTLNLAATVLGLFYVPFLLGFMILIRNVPDTSGFSSHFGGKLIIVVFLCIWVCDSAAYIAGSRLGKHKLFPRVSPNKSIEGTLFGFVFAVLTAYLSQITFLQEVALHHVLMIGVICGSIGQLSDLVESMFKRDANVKDSSSLIPGHGGVLDRFDSQMLVAPVVFGYLQLMVF